MGCQWIETPDGAMVVCGRFQSPRPCAECGKEARFLCDWILQRATAARRRHRRCSRPLCADHAAKPPGARGKHLCPEHERAREAWERRRAEAAT